MVLEMSSEAEPLGEGLTAAMAGQWPCLTHSRSALFQRIELNLARVDLFFPDLLPFKSAAPQSPTSCIMHRSGSEINQSLKEMDLYSRLSSGAGFLPSPPSSLGVLSTDATMPRGACRQAGRGGRAQWAPGFKSTSCCCCVALVSSPSSLRLLPLQFVERTQSPGLQK